MLPTRSNIEPEWVEGSEWASQGPGAQPVNSLGILYLWIQIT